MSQPITTTDLLRRARQVITPPGRWIKHRREDEEGRVCSVGALVTATQLLGVTTDDALFRAAVSRLARGTSGGRMSDLTNFNDAEETTHEDVLRLFDRAIGGK